MFHLSEYPFNINGRYHFFLWLHCMSKQIKVGGIISVGGKTEKNRLRQMTYGIIVLTVLSPHGQ